jgi:plasmid stability protein
MPRLLACAVIRDDPPIVFLADDQETLNWVLALRVVAATPGRQVSPEAREQLRQALLEERWGDAVTAWIEHTGIPVDVYSSIDLYTADDVSMASLELQFQPLFED